MDLSEKGRKALEDLGLTGYEIKAYICLLEFGPVTASELSKKCGVPYSKIYDVLNSLEQKGWIETSSSRPQKFFPKSPHTAIETTKMLIDNRLKTSENLVVAELSPVYERTGIKERPEIWVVRGLYNIASKVMEIIETCQEELLVAIPEISENIARTVQPALRSLSEKGVKITVLVSSMTNSEIVRAISRVADVRVKDSMFGGGVIGDTSQVMILLGDAKGGSGNPEPIAIWANHSGLARFAKEYFQYLWRDAPTPGQRS
ncbi:MAG TPA: helix-turn-helix domain-containing protein [Nitrososphaeraceae archaeon]|jgi:sugar-specific transcriptional regulator TrmB